MVYKIIQNALIRNDRHEPAYKLKPPLQSISYSLSRTIIYFICHNYGTRNPFARMLVVISRSHAISMTVPLLLRQRTEEGK